MMLLGKNLTSSDILQKKNTKNSVPDKSSMFSKQQFSLEELVSPEYFQNKKSEASFRILKSTHKMYHFKQEKCYPI